MPPDAQPIRDLHSTWIDAVNAGDLARLLTLMADDVVFLGPGRQPLGRDGFAAVFPAAHQQARIHCTSDLEEVVVAGEVAYTRSRDRLTVTPRTNPASAQPTHLAGHRVTIYRKHPDARWLLARDVHTLAEVP
jgi:uncharacterized protein (TIGR02246 family)